MYGCSDASVVDGDKHQCMGALMRVWWTETNTNVWVL